MLMILKTSLCLLVVKTGSPVHRNNPNVNEAATPSGTNTDNKQVRIRYFVINNEALILFLDGFVL